MANEVAILDYFLKWERETPSAIFLRQPINRTWVNYSWKEVGHAAREICGTLQEKGFSRGDRVAILSANCAQWIICDIAMIMGGFISVPLYANVNADSMRHILKASGCTFMFVGKLLPKDWDNVKDAIPDSVQAVCMAGYQKEGLTTWENFIQPSTNAQIQKQTGEDVVTYIYTSGTTGEPKGVIHTNSSIVNAVLTAVDSVNLNRPGNRFLSYLPLSHAAERGLIEAGCLYCGGTIAFVESIERFNSNIKEIKPTHFFGVPRIWEKFHSKILEKIPQKKLMLLLKTPIVSFIIKNKIKKSLGLEKADVILSGAAAILPDLLLWYQKLGIIIREAYGMSENFNVLSLNPKNDVRIGTVGKLFSNQEVIIDPETHEIKQKCNWLMKGYYNKPELTAKTIINGFLHTGDMGELSEDGFLKVTGRVKDIFKTSKGEYISPAPIEVKFLELPGVSQACVMGSKYAQPFIIISLSSIGNIMEKSEMERQLKNVLHVHNQHGMEYQKLKKVFVTKEEWTIDNGLLTPTLKMKRNELSNKYEGTMYDLYHNDKLICWEK